MFIVYIINFGLLSLKDILNAIWFVYLGKYYGWREHIGNQESDTQGPK